MEIVKIFISSIIMLLTTYIFGRILNLKSRKTLLETIIALFICSILYTLIYINIDNTVKTILVCLVYSITIYNIFELSIVKALFLGIIYMILLLVPDLIVTISLSYLIGKEHFYSSFSGSIISNAAVSIIMVTIIILLKTPLKKLINYKLSTSKKIVLVSSFVLVSLAIFFYTLISKFEFSDNIAGYLIVIVTLISILFYLFKQKIDNEAILKRYDDLLAVTKTYENDVENQRTMIHENRNELMTIKCKLNDKVNKDEIIKYIDSVLGDKKSTTISKYSKFIHLPSNGIKGFFYYKFMEAERRNIKVSVNISKQIENSFLGNLDTRDFKDLVRIIGVYLDNAIEASAESNDKKLGIEVYLIKNDIEIILSNTFNNEIDVEKIGKERFTTKGKNHGHGLLLVRHILNNNSIFEAKKEIINNVYIQKLKIINKKTQ